MFESTQDESKQVVVKLDELGKVSIEGVGFTGGECKDVTKSLEQAVISTSVHCAVQEKPEFHENTDGTVTVEKTMW